MSSKSGSPGPQCYNDPRTQQGSFRTFVQMWHLEWAKRLLTRSSSRELPSCTKNCHLKGSRLQNHTCEYNGVRRHNRPRMNNSCNRLPAKTRQPSDSTASTNGYARRPRCQSFNRSMQPSGKTKGFQETHACLLQAWVQDGSSCSTINDVTDKGKPPHGIASAATVLGKIKSLTSWTMKQADTSPAIIGKEPWTHSQQKVMRPFKNLSGNGDNKKDNVLDSSTRNICRQWATVALC